MSHVTDNLEMECDTELELEAEAEGLAQISQCENISDTVTGHIFRYEPRESSGHLRHTTQSVVHTIDSLSFRTKKSRFGCRQKSEIFGNHILGSIRGHTGLVCTIRDTGNLNMKNTLKFALRL